VRQMADARRFILERSRGLDELKSYKEEERFESDSHDFHVVQFDVTPFYRAASVRSIFDNVLFVAMNAEISISETLDNITIRENDDHSFQEYGKGIVYHRLASISNQGVMVESSNVVFYDYDQESFGGLGSALLITPHRRVVHRINSEGKQVDEAELVVTLKRWALSTLHKPTMSIAPDVHQRLVDDTGQWMTQMIAAIRHQLSVYSLS
jgi:hypothetical protein